MWRYTDDPATDWDAYCREMDEHDRKDDADAFDFDPMDYCPEY